jgi:quercetin dioxygenase-like cupin family protein
LFYEVITVKVVDIEPSLKVSKRIIDAIGSTSRFDEHDMEAGVAHFAAGLKTHWHKHTSEQLLYVLEGKGVIGTENEQQIATPGKAFVIPKDTKHFQAATEESSFTFLFVLKFPNSTTTESSFPDITMLEKTASGSEHK